MNNILFKGQHDFRSGHSCETALHELISDLNVNRNKKLINILLFIDFRKAFDLVDSRMLLRKLFHYGFEKSALDLVANYFKDRYQAVKFEKKITPLMSLELGVPQGSVLGPLFFLIFINDLAYIIQSYCKMFADDTTLYDAGENLNALISKFKNNLESLINWCQFNKLDLNWSKTFFMFITNKKVKLPNEIEVGKNMVQVVKSFKLLGVTIDNKLNFSEHCTNVKKLINRKIYSIKRLFYLATTVKIQFFKTFILPYFDYCSTLLIYFPKQSIQSLNSCFNLCLFKLFKLKPEKIDFEEYLPENYQDLVMENFSKKLHDYGLFTFQKRLLDRFLLFAHSILNYEKSPAELKRIIKLPDNSSDDPDFEPFNFRDGPRPRNIIPATKFDRYTFRYFFPRLISKINMAYSNVEFNSKPEPFKAQISILSKDIQKMFLECFPNFSVTYFTFYRKKNDKKKKRR